MIRSVLALAALAVLVGRTHSADEPPGPKINWPDVKGMERREPKLAPKTEDGYSIAYNGPNVAVTVYVFNRGLKKIPDGPKSDEVKNEMNGLVMAIHTAQKKGTYKSVKELGKAETVPLGKGKDAPSALRQRFEIEFDGGLRSSEGYVTGFKDHFLKIRITFDPNDKNAPDKIAAVLDAIGKAIK